MSDTIEKVDFAVEANSYESLCIWEQFNEKCTWVQHTRGAMRQIGELAGRPIWVTLFWNTINGKKVLFYEATSQVVDYEMVENWIRKNALNEHGIRTDAMNFHIIWHEVNK
jgi:hypothetical protein